MNLNNKIEEFYEICGDWNYRNIDMSDPHLQGIEILNDNITIYCGLFSPELDDYVSCKAGTYQNKLLVEKFKKLNLSNKEDVLDFISEINKLINWDEVNDELYKQEDIEKKEIDL